MKRSVSFSVDNQAYEIIRHEAAAKGLRPSEFSRMAVFSHINKYPSKGVFSELDDIRYQKSENSSTDPTNVGSQGK